jgi:ATP-dependent exoDNAse (exonuclease V) alpha subunit
MESRPLTQLENAVAQSKDPKGRKLPDVVELGIGMPCMVTMNVKTKHDLANGTRGTLADIILDPREHEIDTNSSTHHLQYPPRFILFQPDETRAANLPGLPEGVYPIEPITSNYKVVIQGKTTSVERRQIPVTGGYAFTDYRSQGQTLPAVIVDLAQPPTGKLTPFGAYVALSRSKGRDTIRLLREFDDKIFTTHPSESLRVENLRLERQDQLTKEWWNHKM